MDGLTSYPGRRSGLTLQKPILQFVDWKRYFPYQLFLQFFCRFCQTCDCVSGFVCLLTMDSSTIAFLTLYHIFCIASAQQCRDEYFICGMMLRRHIFKKMKALNWKPCVQACEDGIKCQSMNYVIGQEMCELNDRTKEARPEDFVPVWQRSYMKRFRKRGI